MSGSTKNNLVGVRFGRMVITEQKRGPAKGRKYDIDLCVIQCDCGTIKTLCLHNVTNGSTKSCGCLRNEGPIKPLDLSGRVFGKLTVLALHHVRQRSESEKRIIRRMRMWLCRCECGKQKVIPQENLMRGDTRSCGCIFGKNPHGRLPQYEASLNQIYSSYKKGARTRDLVFDIPEDDFEKLVTANCHYCGIEPLQGWCRHRDINGVLLHNGVDRMDHNIGYIMSNVVTCCKRCNISKREMGYDEFLNWVERVYNHVRGFIKS